MVSPRRFKAKPVTVEAVQFTGGVEHAEQILKWIRDADGTARFADTEPDTMFRGQVVRIGNPELIFIETLLGLERVFKDDWIIQRFDEDGPYFEVIPSNVFASKYDPVEICYVRT